MRAWVAGALALMVSGCSGGWVYEKGLAYDSYADRAAVSGHAHATIAAAEEGRAVDWRSAKGMGRVTPVAQAYTDGGGRTCRVLKQEITWKSVTQSREAEACRLKDGTWIVTDRPVGS